MPGFSVLIITIAQCDCATSHAVISCFMCLDLQELGYKGEVGYQTFLYSNEGDIRKILMFLVDKLPRSTSGAADDSTSGAGELFAEY